jgi:hypothetical protein
MSLTDKFGLISTSALGLIRGLYPFVAASVLVVWEFTIPVYGAVIKTQFWGQIVFWAVTLVNMLVPKLRYKYLAPSTFICLIFAVTLICVHSIWINPDKKEFFQSPDIFEVFIIAFLVYITILLTGELIILALTQKDRRRNPALIGSSATKRSGRSYYLHAFANNVFLILLLGMIIHYNEDTCDTDSYRAYKVATVTLIVIHAVGIAKDILYVMFSTISKSGNDFQRCCLFCVYLIEGLVFFMVAIYVTIEDASTHNDCRQKALFIAFVLKFTKHCLIVYGSLGLGACVFLIASIGVFASRSASESVDNPESTKKFSDSYILDLEKKQREIIRQNLLAKEGDTKDDI